jgi:hypothetical protein
MDQYFVVNPVVTALGYGCLGCDATDTMAPPAFILGETPIKTSDHVKAAIAAAGLHPKAKKYRTTTETPQNSGLVGLQRKSQVTSAVLPPAL